MPAPTRLQDLAPGLRGRRVSLGAWPTPVRALDVGATAPLWCKDEGHASAAYGGNKIRKLEWVLPRVGRDRAVVTIGAVGSNHVLATAVHGRALGVKVHAVLVPQPGTAAARRNAGVTGALAHRLWPAGGEAGAAATLGRALVAAAREDGRRPALVWIGGSTPRGVLGWVQGALEIADQVAAGILPAPAHVFVPAGSGGIAAGLLVGFDLAGLDTTVHAVRVADPLWANRRAILTLARASARVLRRAGGPRVRPDPRRLVLDTRWFGGVYGAPTEAGRAAQALAEDLGLGIEPTYSAKTLAAAAHALRAGEARGPVLWVDTANARPLEDLAGGAVPDPPAVLLPLLTPLSGARA
jgi:D-cysteine desulfhydrase